MLISSRSNLDNLELRHIQRAPQQYEKAVRPDRIDHLKSVTNIAISLIAATPFVAIFLVAVVRNFFPEFVSWIVAGLAFAALVVATVILLPWSRSTLQSTKRLRQEIIDGKHRAFFVTDKDYSFIVMNDALFEEIDEQEQHLMAAFWADDTVAENDRVLRHDGWPNAETARRHRDAKLETIKIGQQYFAAYSGIEDASQHEHFVTITKEAYEQYDTEISMFESQLANAKKSE